jgi:hypothetical protein
LSWGDSTSLHHPPRTQQLSSETTKTVSVSQTHQPR